MVSNVAPTEAGFLPVCGVEGPRRVSPERGGAGGKSWGGGEGAQPGPAEDLLRQGSRKDRRDETKIPRTEEGGGRDLGRGAAKPPAQPPGWWEGLDSLAKSFFKDSGKLFLAASDPLPEKESSELA